MKLRPLGEGYQYEFDNLWVSGTDGIHRWRADSAPAECFADAEEPTKPSMSDGYRSTDDIEPGDGLAHTLDEGLVDAEEPLREGDRVVVVDEPAEPTDQDNAGRYGVITSLEVLPAAEGPKRAAKVTFDSGQHGCVWVRNLRHERPDERPAEKPEPPPRKYADGQWVIPAGVRPAHQISHAENRPEAGGEWCYVLVDRRGKELLGVWAESNLEPCPPPLTDAQRRLQPGDKVGVRVQRWDGEGKPVKVPSPKGIYKIVSSQLLGEVVRVFLEGDDCFGESLHNLDPAEGVQ